MVLSILPIGKVVPVCPTISVNGPVGELDFLQTIDPTELVSVMAWGVEFLQIVCETGLMVPVFVAGLIETKTALL